MLIDAACMPALHMLAQTMHAIYSSTRRLKELELIATSGI